MTKQHRKVLEKEIEFLARDLDEAVQKLVTITRLLAASSRPALKPRQAKPPGSSSTEASKRGT